MSSKADEAQSGASEHLVQPAHFAPLAPGGSRSQGTANPIDFLYDVGLQVAVELGRADMTVRDILGLHLGSTIELNRVAGEPVDILINGRAIARGEVVVIDDMFGVRVTEILSPHDRITALR